MNKKIVGDRFTLYLGDCYNLIDQIAPHVDALITDNPYGMGLDTQYGSGGRSSMASSNDYPSIYGDDSPFDPRPFLDFETSILFGVNHFCSMMPSNKGTWIVWDKLDGLTSKREFGFNDNSDFELIWCNKKGPDRIIRHRWMGAMKGSENKQKRIHPTQKPIKLMEMLINQYTEEGDVIFDPFMGVGTTGLAAIKNNRNFIGVEINSDYFRLAHERIANASDLFLTTEKERSSGAVSIFDYLNGGALAS